MPSQRESEGFIGSAKRFLQLEYLVKPFHRLFTLDDHAKQYPYAEVERVPVGTLMIYAGAIPLGILVAWTALSQPGWHKAHVTILGLIVSLILTSFVTDLIKNGVGRPRPDLIDRCQPKDGTPRDKLVSIEVCTQTNQHKLQDGWRSFPSGHSSFAFAGFTYLSLGGADLSRFLLVLAPLLCALMIAISRTEDYRHDVFDVTAGSALGLTLSYLTYRRYYPGVKSVKCDTPYPQSIENSGRGQYRRQRDEETGRVGDDDSEGESYPLQPISKTRSQD